MITFQAEDRISKERFIDITQFAALNDALGPWLEVVFHLATYGYDSVNEDLKRRIDLTMKEPTLCVLYYDSAPFSMTFRMKKIIPQSILNGKPLYEDWFNGGLTYSGPGVRLDGSHPSLTVSLDPEAYHGTRHKWSIHT